MDMGESFIFPNAHFLPPAFNTPLKSIIENRNPVLLMHDSMDTELILTGSLRSTTT